MPSRMEFNLTAMIFCKHAGEFFPIFWPDIFNHGQRFHIFIQPWLSCANILYVSQEVA